jgi:hypothetical protein
LAYATSLAAFMPYILSGIKVILRNRNYELEYLVLENSRQIPFFIDLHSVFSCSARGFPALPHRSGLHPPSARWPSG